MFNWQINYHTIGKEITNPKKKKKTLVKEIHFDTLYRLLKNTDWSMTPIYEMYI
jgi:hypothetical protein